ncbi:MAG: DUF4097 family beta strand repeat protein, partial [Gemmatimonadota bacterium]
MSPKFYIIPVLIMGGGAAFLMSWKADKREQQHQHEHVTVSIAHSQEVADEWCHQGSSNRKNWHCEVREFTVPLGSFEGVTSTNGNIQVEAWDKDEVFIRAKVEGRAGSYDAARELVSAISLATSNDILKASGPKRGRGSSWSVSYRAMVPMKSDLTVSATNGNVTVVEVMGDLSARSTNGNVQLRGVGGDVSGGTTNGNVKIELAGNAWVGDGVDVRTTNGSIDLSIPGDYNGVLEAATVNGGISVDFPVTVTGKISKKLYAELGDGGATIKAVTTNGSVRIGRTEARLPGVPVI